MDKKPLKSNLSNTGFNLNKVIEFRQELHSYPELSFKEFDTKRRLLEYLQKLPLFKANAKVTETETAGFWVEIWGTGSNSLEKQMLISFRADMDALPLTEKTGLPYSSKNEGAAHMCGHDGHMAILIGTIEYFLLSLEKVPKNFGIRFLFQPAEEIGQGADKVIKAGCLENVAEMYGLHNYAKFFKAGEIACCHNTVFAGLVTFDIRITGKGGHGSTPHLCNNPIIPAANIVLAINQIPSQEVNAKESCVVSVGKIVSGTKENIIPESAQIKGTIRGLSKERLNSVFNRISEISQHISTMYGCSAEVINEVLLIPTVNTKAPTQLVFEIAEKYFNLTHEHLPIMASEDFGLYSDHIPGCLFLLGGEDEDHNFIIHSPNYNFNDRTLGVGIEFFLRIAEAKCGEKILS